MRVDPVVVDLTDELSGKDVWFVGDIHGRMELLEQFLDRINYHPEKHAILSVGDLVDRGARNIEVVEFFRRFGRAVRGNHERMWLEMREMHRALPYDDQGNIHPAYLYLQGERWRGNGHWSTLTEYAKSPFSASTWLDFFETLPTSIIYGDYLLVHAGVYPTKSFEEHTEEDLLWVRKEYIFHRELILPECRMGRQLVTGHTQTWQYYEAGKVVIRPDRILLDLGAADNVGLGAYQANTGREIFIRGLGWDERIRA